jgi:methyl-accepting chemotaxis protein
MRLSNTTVKTKLIWGFSAILIPLILVTIVGLRGMSSTHSDLVRVLTDDMVKVRLANGMLDEINVIARAIRNVALLTDEKMMQAEKQRIVDARGNFQQTYATLFGMVKSDQGKSLLAGITISREKVDALADKVLELGLANKAAAATEVLINELRLPQRKLIEDIGGLIQFQEDKMKNTAEEAKRSYAHNWTFMVTLSSLAIVLGVLAAFFLGGNISRSLLRISAGLGESAEQVASASGQVASASQSLAEGASEQAAAIEETSSSIEQMSSMIKQNAGNADEAKSLMAEAKELVRAANETMAGLTESMEEISKASEETAKIIKTIDEIAFQTNLLALNAAVEAARAGEAGAGFAVVADEVRNLAMRAGKASMNTATLIESTIKRVEGGSQLVTRTNEAFNAVAKSATKVAQLVGEIAAASSEQSQGIDQINKAVAEMDKVVQQNAANAEETASASEEMNAQAVEMKGFVAELAAMVSGNGNGNGLMNTYRRVVQPTPIRTATSRHGISNQKAASKISRKGEITPTPLISLENADADFADF